MSSTKPPLDPDSTLCRVLEAVSTEPWSEFNWSLLKDLTEELGLDKGMAKEVSRYTASQLASSWIPGPDNSWSSYVRFSDYEAARQKMMEFLSEAYGEFTTRR